MTGHAMLLSFLFPWARLDGKWLWDLIEELTWTEHQGSGRTMTVAEILELPVTRIEWLVRRGAERRHRVAKAIAQASKRK